MKPAQNPRHGLGSDYRLNSQCCKVTTAVHQAKPVFYMLISTAMLIILVYMFSLSFGPEAWSKQRDLTRHHVSHQVHQTAHLMRI
ncbi:hypothetical protein KF707_01415 [Candidatus Obscuribacterales bacterium]|nr:hypothetical protein [Candidatus Obscuribacterales bacterium]MBX3134863.1 hypothetical protein [Candidatus Obscuribacterales bacterium]MBX3154002.1 hypothetical protein [Candidatus Obscuribacterales bacterium]